MHLRKSHDPQPRKNSVPERTKNEDEAITGTSAEIFVPIFFGRDVDQLSRAHSQFLSAHGIQLLSNKEYNFSASLYN
jgi:hypothetical protein